MIKWVLRLVLLAVPLLLVAGVAAVVTNWHNVDGRVGHQAAHVVVTRLEKQPGAARHHSHHRHHHPRHHAHRSTADAI